jgi:hypothetical protein
MICSDSNCNTALQPAWFTITGSSLELEMASHYSLKSGLYLAARTGSDVLQINAVTFQLCNVLTSLFDFEVYIAVPSAGDHQISYSTYSSWASDQS